MSTIYDFKAKRIDGTDQDFNEYKGKTLLIVNVASKCGNTPQYEGLEELYNINKEKGLVILGFPCDQFMNQEPGDDQEIQSFCKKNYGVTFPLFSKIKVNGDDTHPIYKFLKSEQPGLFGTEFVKWNFTKFLVDSNGNVVKRFSPGDTPSSIAKDINRFLP